MSLSGSTNTNKSTQTFITALVTNLIVGGVELLAFTLIRNRFRKVYSPRSYLVPVNKRSAPPPHGLLAWIPAIFKADAKDIIKKNGLDAYVFIRFLYLMIEVFFPFTIVTWLVLFPVDAANSGGQTSSLTMFTFGNIKNTNTKRYAAHLLMVYLLTFYVFYLIRREMQEYVNLRQDFLMSPEHSKLAQARTVLVTGVPKEYLSFDAMKRFCNVFPGGARHIWIHRDLKKLPDVYKKRDKAVAQLEKAETGILKKATKNITKQKKKNPELAVDPTDIDAFIKAKKRPSHKLGWKGFFGKKVDTLNWTREEIPKRNAELEEMRSYFGTPEEDEKYPAHSAVFVEFNKQIAAHMFAQCLAHHAPLRMSARYLEVSQPDVIWDNLSISPYNARGRYVVSWVATIGLIVLWAFPVAFVGMISNVSSLCATVSWMAWLCTLPTPVNGIIQGALPPAALAVLFMFLPIVLRLFARLQGIPLRTGIELSLMTRFFIFLVIHGFLIVTLSSGLVAAIPSITQDPSSAVTLLATKLPEASTFFLTYIVTTTLSGAAGSLLQVSTLIVYYVKLYLLGSTPRSVFGIKYSMSKVAWGTLFPNVSLLVVISLVYSVIAPLVCAFACFGFFLYWFVYKYLFTWVYDMPANGETGGLFYPKALGHIFVGLYIEQICWCGLFFLSQNENSHPSAIPEGVFMVILVVITILFHMTMNSGYHPLNDYLPISAAGKIDELLAARKRTGSVTLAPADDGSIKPVSTSYPPQLDSPQKGEKLTTEKDGLVYNNGDYNDSAQLLNTPEEDLDVNAFNHPCIYEGYKTVWLPKDEYGFYEKEISSNQAANVDSSSLGAVMNAKAKVDVSRGPPDEPWHESQSFV